MAIGDGIRRNIALISETERVKYINAILKMDTTKLFADGVTYWDKQEEIHKNGHLHGLGVHGGIEFVPWHRALCNRFEDLLREVDPELSLHYWDWTTDPRVALPGGVALFTDIFMDNANGDVSHLLDDFESSEPGHAKVWRDVANTNANPDGTPDVLSDTDMLNGVTDFNTLANTGHLGNSGSHGRAHMYIGGSIFDAHYSFHDPFVFFLHSNLDRLWAKWQTDPDHPERLTVAGAYSGVSSTDSSSLTNDNVDPWAGGTGLEPWASDPTKRSVIKYTDLSIIIPRCYDTNQSNFYVAESENPINAATGRYRVNFNSIPEEETSWRAAVLKVYSCEDATFRVQAGTEPGAPFSIVFPPLGQAIAEHDSQATHGYSEVRIWFSFAAGAVGTAPQLIGPVNTVIECVETGQTFNFELIADTIHRQTVAVQLVLDQSGSMSDPAGTSGLIRLQVLKDSATLFANLIQKNNGIGLIRFDDNAYPPNDPTFPGMIISKVSSDAFTDATRNTARNQIMLQGAHGNTSIGDGIAMGKMQLDTIPAGTYDQKAMIVFTDGLQNQPQSIEDVASSITSQTFAIGLGSETQVNTLELNNIANGSGGYLFVSGLLSASIDDTYRLQKFFMQILASVTNTQIIKDPVGFINIGNKIKIPFQLCVADINCRVITLFEFPFINVSIEAPDGQITTPANAAAHHAQFDNNDLDTITCSFGLPIVNGSKKNHNGTWYVILEVDGPTYKKVVSKQERKNRQIITKGSKYCVSVHSYSNIKMKAHLNQSSLEPGAHMTLRTTLTEYDVPLQRAAVDVHVTNPDKTITNFTLKEIESGIYSGTMIAAMSGTYHFHLIASGVDYKAVSFTREAILNGSVFLGGNRPATPVSEDKDLCKLISCLVRDKGIQALLEKKKINPKVFTECLCGEKKTPRQ
ncbi:MAG: tyrosinase family protein [Ferruginibacter sp.]